MKHRPSHNINESCRSINKILKVIIENIDNLEYDGPEDKTPEFRKLPYEHSTSYLQDLYGYNTNTGDIGDFGPVYTIDDVAQIKRLIDSGKAEAAKERYQYDTIENLIFLVAHDDMYNVAMVNKSKLGQATHDYIIIRLDVAADGKADIVVDWNWDGYGEQRFKSYKKFLKIMTDAYNYGLGDID